MVRKQKEEVTREASMTCGICQDPPWPWLLFLQKTHAILLPYGTHLCWVFCAPTHTSWHKAVTVDGFAIKSYLSWLWHSLMWSLEALTCILATLKTPENMNRQSPQSRPASCLSPQAELKSSKPWLPLPSQCIGQAIHVPNHVKAETKHCCKGNRHWNMIKSSQLVSCTAHAHACLGFQVSPFPNDQWAHWSPWDPCIHNKWFCHVAEIHMPNNYIAVSRECIISILAQILPKAVCPPGVRIYAGMPSPYCILSRQSLSTKHSGSQ